MADKNILKKDGGEKERLLKGSFFKLAFAAMVIMIILLLYLPFLFRQGLFIKVIFYIVVGFVLLDSIILLHKLFLYVRYNKKVKFKDLCKKEREGTADVTDKTKTSEREATTKEIKETARKEIKKEDNIGQKGAVIEKKGSGNFYFILFLISIVLFGIAYLYGDMLVGNIALILMVISLVGYRILKKEKWRKAPKIKKEKTIKKEEKAGYKEIRIERKGLKNFYFILFLINIVLFLVAYLYKNMLALGGALTLISMSLICYRILKTKKAEKKPKEVSKLPEKDKVVRIKKEKIPLVKELPKSLGIELKDYETDLDILYRIVEQKGRVRLSALVNYLGIDKKRVEEWATILEEHSLVEVHYPPIGGPELRKCGK